jgi:hypothetical protein
MNKPVLVKCSFVVHYAMPGINAESSRRFLFVRCFSDLRLKLIIETSRAFPLEWYQLAGGRVVRTSSST